MVFSGAMLGAPLVSAETPANKPAEKQVKPKAPPADTVASVQKELDTVNKKVDAQVKAVTEAQNEAARKAATAKLEAARKEKADIEKRLAALKQPPPVTDKKLPPPVPDTPVAKLEKQRAELDTKIKAAVDAVSAAQSDADRKAAKAKLTSLQTEREAVDKQLAAEKAKLTKRPRTDESDKPIGRGFILA